MLTANTKIHYLIFAESRLNSSEELRIEEEYQDLLKGTKNYYSKNAVWNSNK